MKLYKITLIIGLALFEKSYCQYTDEINTNRPSESMSAYSVGKTVIQLESGLNYYEEKNQYAGSDAKGYMVKFDTRYGVFKEELEAILEINYQNDKYETDILSKNRNGVKNSSLGFKYLFYDPHKNYVEKPNIYSWKANHRFKWHSMIPSIALYGGFNLNFSNNPFVPRDPKLGNITPKFMLICQNNFPSGVIFILNIFADKIGSDYQTEGFIATFSRSVGEKWSVFFENKSYKGNYYPTNSVFSTGATFLVNKDTQIDCTIGKNIMDNPSQFYAGLGISWRSDTNYKEVILKEKKTKSKTDKKMDKKKDKEKKSKRVDTFETPKP